MKRYMEMKLTFGTITMDVVVRELYVKWVQPENNEKKYREVVAVTFDAVEPPNFRDDKESKKVTFTMRSLFIADDLFTFVIPKIDEYKILTLEKGDSTRVTFVRNLEKIPMAENDFDTEDDEDEFDEFLKKRNKKTYITEARPLLFVDSSDIFAIPFEKKEKVYKVVRNQMPTPMVPNMKEPTILAGQLSTDTKTAKKILDIIDEKIAYSHDIDERLLQEAKKMVSIYENWVNEVFYILNARKLLRPLDVIVSSGGKKVYEIVIDERIIEYEIQKRCINGILKFSFPPAETTKEIRSLSEYTEHFAEAITNRIEAIAKPLTRRGQVPEEIEKYFRVFLREPLKAQKSAIYSALKALEEKNRVLYISETGTGKSLMMSATAWIDSEIEKKPMKLLIMCPDHLMDTVWEEEILKTFPDVKVHKIKSIQDVIHYEKKGYLDDGIKRAFILGQKYAKAHYAFKPAINWVKRGKELHFVCPDCGKTVVKKIKILNMLTKHWETKLVPAPIDYFSDVNKDNYKCKHCRTVLWEPVTPAKRTPKNFIFTNELGFIPKEPDAVRNEIENIRKQLEKMFVGSSPEYKKTKEVLIAYRKAEMIIKKGKSDTKRAFKVSLAEYIAKKLKYRFTHLILDEIHEFCGDSLRSEAAEKLVHSVRKIIGGTGTIMNGYAESFFRIAFMYNPEKMIRSGYRYDDASKFQADYGIIEERYKLIRKGRKLKYQALTPKKRPGISPLIFPLFMQDIGVFCSMDELELELPKLEHYNVPVPMDETLKAAQQKLLLQIRKKDIRDKHYFRNTVVLNYSFLDTPGVKKYLRDEDGVVILETPTIEVHKDNKLQELINIARNEVWGEKRRMMVYTYFAGDHINEYLYDHLTNYGFMCTVLNPTNEYSVSCDGCRMKINKEDREKFIRTEVTKGTEILICNPELVKTGYNLIDFPTIVHYQLSYQVFTNRQADRRSWRIGQTRDCKIIYLYYEDTIQEQVASLMATKIVASRAIEGHLDEDGLNAIANDRTAEEELQSMFYNGIKGKVVGLKRYHATLSSESVSSFSSSEE